MNEEVPPSNPCATPAIPFAEPEKGVPTGAAPNTSSPSEAPSSTQQLLTKIRLLTEENKQLHAKLQSNWDVARQQHFVQFATEKLNDLIASRKRERGEEDKVESGVTQAEYDTLSRQYQCAQQTLDATTRTLNEEQARAASLQRTLSDMESQVISPLRLQATELSEKHDALSQQLASVLESQGSMYGKLSGEVEAKAAQIVQLNEIIQQREQALREVGQQLAHTSESVSQLQSKLAGMDAQTCELQMAHQKELVEAESRLQHVTEQQEKAVEEGKIQISVLTTQLSDMRGNLEQLQAENQAERLRHSELQAQFLALQMRQERDNAMRVEAPRPSITSSAIQAEIPIPSYDFAEEKSTRENLISFWVAGHQTIHQLQQQAEELRSALGAAKTSNEQIAEMRQERTRTMDAFAALTSEIERAREDNKTLRSKLSGVEVQNRFLTEHLVRALEGAMTSDQLDEAARAIRDAATNAAAASATAFASDPESLRQARHEVQNLKYERTRLSKEASELDRLVKIRQMKLESLSANIALHSLAQLPDTQLPSSRLMSIVDACAGASTGMADAQELERKRKRVEDIEQQSQANSDLESLRLKVEQQETLIAALQCQLEEAKCSMKDDQRLHEVEVAKLRELVDSTVRMSQNAEQKCSSAEQQNRVLSSSFDNAAKSLTVLSLTLEQELNLTQRQRQQIDSLMKSLQTAASGETTRRDDNNSESAGCSPQLISALEQHYNLMKERAASIRRAEESQDSERVLSVLSVMHNKDEEIARLVQEKNALEQSLTQQLQQEIRKVEHLSAQLSHEKAIAERAQTAAAAAEKERQKMQDQLRGQADYLQLTISKTTIAQQPPSAASKFDKPQQQAPKPIPQTQPSTAATGNTANLSSAATRAAELARRAQHLAEATEVAKDATAA